MLLKIAAPTGREYVPLQEAAGRVLASEVTAYISIPPFSRSPYDGYAFRAADTAGAAKSHPAVLEIVEEVAAGWISLTVLSVCA